MSKKIKTLIFGEQHECRAVSELIKQNSLLNAYTHEHLHLDDLEYLEEHLTNWDPSLVIVVADGAKGLESVSRTREHRPMLSVFWFSNDQDFSMQSYRLNCAYFSTKPVTQTKLERGIRRCQHIGLTYATE